MSEPLYGKQLTALDHRLIWWLLANQTVADGRPTGIVPGGWRARAVLDLQTHRPLLWAAEKRLRAAGVIQSERYQRDLRIDGSVFG